MSYLTWRKDNEDRLLQLVNYAEIDQLPMFTESARNDLSSTVVAPIVEKMVEKDLMIPVNFIGVFCEYLYEEYHLSPVDVEVLIQTMIASEIKFLNRMAQTASVSASRTIYERLKEILPEHVRPYLDEAFEFLEPEEKGDEMNDP